MFKKLMKTFGVIVTVLLVILALTSVVLLVKTKVQSTQLPTILGYRLMAVLTGSMRPSIDPGDMVVVKVVDPEKVKAGDVITFKANDNIFITHRVTEVFNEDGQTIFKTKGDANNIEDQEFVSKDQIVGTLSATVPYGGYVARFIRSKGGFFLFIVLPITILVASEFYSVLKKMKKEKERLILEEKMNTEN